MTEVRAVDLLVRVLRGAHRDRLRRAPVERREGHAGRGCRHTGVAELARHRHRHGRARRRRQLHRVGGRAALPNRHFGRVKHQRLPRVRRRRNGRRGVRLGGRGARANGGHRPHLELVGRAVGQAVENMASGACVGARNGRPRAPNIASLPLILPAGERPAAIGPKGPMQRDLPWASSKRRRSPRRSWLGIVGGRGVRVR